MGFTRPLGELSKEDAGIAGGKGASLGEMERAGIPTLPGFAVLTRAFEEFLGKAGGARPETMQALILGRDVPDRIASEIREAFRKLGARYVAVRSSATCEDSATDAWAGQLDTYLNTTAGELLDNVRRCWASLFSARAMCYREERGLRDRHVSVAVVVQKMAQSEIAGTAFSVHPVTQNPDEMIIEAGYGLGEALVSGQITPDAYVVEKGSARIKDKHVAGQEEALYRGASGGCEWRPVAARLAGRQKLADAQILRLAEIVLRIESHYGFPCDVEWAFERGRFFIVQSRPITTLRRR